MAKDRTDRTDRDIDAAFEQGTPIEEALNEAVREVVRHHKRMGLPLAVWRDGKTVWLSAEEVEAEYYSDPQPPQ
ncbi:MAG: hypothetical protein NTW96_00250 [Planctomycetia bacterium]|nr:hypothetical protein [Planctomycetia bacterium]